MTRLNVLMQLNSKTKLSPDLENKITSLFLSLPIENRLVLYAKFVHGGNFKAQNGDLFGLNRRLTTKIYKSFLSEVRELLCQSTSQES